MTRAEEAALRTYPYEGGVKGLICENSRQIFVQGYEQAEKDTIERVIDWLEEHFMDNSHHSGRGDFGRIDTLPTFIDSTRMPMQATIDGGVLHSPK